MSAGGIKTVFEAPPRKIDVPCVSFYACGLQDLLYHHKTTRSRPPIGFRIRYLVTAWAKTQVRAQAVLAELVFSALDEADFDVELTVTDSSLWQALGILPRPAFFLLVSIRRPREEPQVPRVLQPPRVDSSLARPFFGRVIGPGHRPLAHARVEVPGLGRATKTDADGRFRFAAMPASSQVREVEVSARGVRKKVTVESSPTPGEPVLVHVDL